MRARSPVARSCSRGRRSGTLGARLAAAGARVEHVPLIAIGPPADGGSALHAALGDLAEFDWLVVTSANGAAAVGDAVAGAPDVRLAAVGPATAAALAGEVGPAGRPRSGGGEQRRAARGVPIGAVPRSPGPGRSRRRPPRRRAARRRSRRRRRRGLRHHAPATRRCPARGPRRRRCGRAGERFGGRGVVAARSATSSTMASPASPPRSSRSDVAPPPSPKRTASLVTAVATAPDDESIVAAVVEALAVR